MTWMWRVWVLAVALVGCGQIFGLDPPALNDAGGGSAADAGMCVAASTDCVSADLLRTCSGPGANVVDTPCPWGCIAGPAHCGQLSPSGGALTPEDLASPQGLEDTELIALAGTIIDADTGQIGTAINRDSVRPAGQGLINGIDYELRNGVAVFRFKTISIGGPVVGAGSHAIALASLGNVQVDALLDMHAQCVTNTPGPGGFAGGPRAMAGSGPGGGGRGIDTRDGGGGAGYGANGGRGGGSGGAGGPAGAAYGMATIDVLVGGSGGSGGGDTAASGVGGGGGGALQIASNGEIVVGSTGGINAGGCGGHGSTGNTSGGGAGGSGGAILLEAPIITIIGALAVNGGGGGAGSDGAFNGAPGRLDRQPALGGIGNGGSGGAGAAGATLAGSAGGNALNAGGGGGGAVGRMRFNTKSGTVGVTPSTSLSPGLDDSPTTTTRGPATVL